MIAITQPLTAETTDNTVLLPTSGAFDNGRIVAWYYDGTRAEYLTIEALAEAHTVSIEDVTAWLKTARAVHYELVINGGHDRNHGRVYGLYDTREAAEKAASALQTQTRDANQNDHARLDLRIDEVFQNVPSVDSDPAIAISRTTRLYGFVNCAANNTMASGDTHFYTSKERRDAELKAFRADAIGRGLSRDAAHSGIYPVAPLLCDVWRDEPEWRNMASLPVMVDCAEAHEEAANPVALSELAEGVCDE